MPESSERILKILCIALAVLLCARLAQVLLRPSPLADVTIPELPSLPEDTQADGKETNAAPAQASTPHHTNQVHQSAGTNNPQAVAGSVTNRSGAKVADTAETNAAPGGVATGTQTTSNVLEHSEQVETNTSSALAKGTPEATNSSTSPIAPNTNRTSLAAADTNASPSAPDESPASATTNSALAHADAIPKATNFSPELASMKAGTNHIEVPSGTNSTSTEAAGATNQSPRSTIAMRGVHLPPGMRMPGMPFGPGRMSGRKPAKLPPDVEARVYRITQSELFGPVIHPMPMALLGIAGNVAFLRAPSGQAGMVKEGDELGGIKLLRIGTNRVLVEEKGAKKELTIFSGLGGESLLPKPETPK